MKKSLVIGIAFLMLLLFVGCENQAEKNKLNIESYTWVMDRIQDAKAEGNYVAIGPNFIAPQKDALVIELECVAQNGKLTLKDDTNQKAYAGTYEIIEESKTSMIYKVYVDGKEGTAVVSNTEYQDKETKPTLVIQIEEYALYCFEK